MLHHISIAVQHPLHVANVLAELCQGCVFPFPVFQNSFLVMTGDAHGTAIEVLPMGTELIPNTEEVGAQMNQLPSSYTATHAAISVKTSQADIERIAQREGWMVRYCDRGPFAVIECWIENQLLFEFLTTEMSLRYAEFMTVENLRAFLAAVPA